MRTLGEDCALLEELRVMDYSLLVGVHFRKTTSEHGQASQAADGDGEAAGAGAGVGADVGGGVGAMNAGGDTNGGLSGLGGLGGGSSGSLGGGSSDDDSYTREGVCGALQRLSASFSGELGARRRSFGHLDDVLSVTPARTPDRRPSPGGAGGGDAIAHASGEREVRMGVNMVAVVQTRSPMRHQAPNSKP